MQKPDRDHRIDGLLMRMKESESEDLKVSLILLTTYISRFSDESIGLSVTTESPKQCAIIRGTIIDKEVVI